MMKKYIAIVCALAVFCVQAVAGGLDGLLTKLNDQARADLSGFSARISAQFGVPEAQVKVVLSTVKEPADAFMVFQLGQMASQPSDKVLQVYQAGKGWGAMAKDLGIKPGSPEFHALKRGDFDLRGGADDSPGKGKGRGKGKHND